MNGISKFWYDITSVLHIYRNLCNFCPSYREFSRYHLNIFQFNTDTHAVSWKTNALISENPNFKYHVEFHSFCNPLWHCMFILLTRPLTIFSWHNSLWSNYNRDIWLILNVEKGSSYDLHVWTWVTLKINREEISLCDAEAHSFQSRGKFSPNLLNVCTTAQEYAGTKIRSLKENEVGNLREMVLMKYQLLSGKMFQNLCPPRSLNTSFRTRSCEENLYWLANEIQNSVCI